MASGDHHWQFGGPRWAECLRIHTWIAEQVEAQKPDVFLSGGDIYEHGSVPEDRLAVAAWLTRIAEVCPVVIARGNHDKIRDLELLGQLKTRNPVIVEEGAAVHIVGGAAIATVAWPRRAHLIASGLFGDGEGAERRALRAVFSGLAEELAAFDGPRIALGHFMVDGAVTSTGQPICGSEMNVGLEDLALFGADIGVMAHIHKPSHWDVAGADFAYTGSPFRTAFGEAEEKSILVGEVTASGATWKRLATPATPMVLIDIGIQQNGTYHAAALPDGLEGAEVRLRLHAAASQRASLQDASATLKAAIEAAGALSVKVEEVITAETRARAPEVAAAVTLKDKLLAHWASKGLSHPRQDGALSRLLSLEGAAQ